MPEAELIDRIVQQVVAAIGGGGGAQRPTVMTTTKTAKAAKPQAAKAKTKAPGKVFVTEAMLARRISTGGGAVVLACNEHLTPAAMDLADEKHVTMTRASATIMSAAGGESAGAIGMMTDRADAKVKSVVSSLCYDGLAMVDYNVGDCWLANLRGLCDAVGGGTLAAGIAILPHGADAMVVANKARGVRAVQGTRLESVARAMRHFDANVLIMEHAFCMFHEMRAMVRMFAAGRAASAAGGAVLNAISNMERA